MEVATMAPPPMLTLLTLVEGLCLVQFRDRVLVRILLKLVLLPSTVQVTQPAALPTTFEKDAILLMWWVPLTLVT